VDIVFFREGDLVVIYLIIIIAVVVSMVFVFVLHRKCVKPVLYSFLVFLSVVFLLHSLSLGFKSITEHEKLVNISIGLCGKQLDKVKIFCGPEFTVNGLTVSVLSKLKINKLSEDEINKVVIRAREIKPLLNVRTLTLNFTTQLVDRESTNKLKGTKVVFYSYNIYKTVQIHK